VKIFLRNIILKGFCAKKKSHHLREKLFKCSIFEAFTLQAKTVEAQTAQKKFT
jgi:hypothetical protein